MDATRIGRVVGAALLVAGGLAACDPAPPPVPFVVSSTAATADHTPGDGICEATPGVGDCTLPAAITEANAVPRATVTVPAGTYTEIDVVIEGRVELTGAGSAQTLLGDSTITIASGANVGITDLGTVPYDGTDLGLAIVADGTLRLDRTQVSRVHPTQLDGIALEVGAGGGVVVTDSILLGGTHGLQNAGSVILDRSAVLNIFDGRIDTLPEGETHHRATIVSRAANTGLPTSSCTGTPAVSHGYAYYAPFAWGCTLASTDVAGTPLPLVTAPATGASLYTVPTTFATVDAIPLGEAGCELGTVDVLGNPRGVDGNGDGVDGCDIGALELQP